MAEIWFYHLERETPERLLPQLLCRGLDRGLKLSVQSVSAERLAAWSQVLWAADDVEFLAHGMSGEPDPLRQPILLSADATNDNGSTFRFLVDGAAPDLAASYVRQSVLFDGQSEDAVSAARTLWREATGLGLTCRYQRQDEGGAWRELAASG